MSEYPDGEDGSQFVGKVDQLSADNRKNASPLIDLFGEETVAKLFASTWQLREEALNIIEDEVIGNSSSYNGDEAFVNAIGASKFTIADKTVSVVQRSSYLLAAVCKQYMRVSLDGGLR